MHAICLQISLQSLFRIFSHASCVHIFRDISGKYSKIHKGFSPFFPSSLKKSDDAICIRQIRNRLSYFTKMLVNTSSIHEHFLFHLTKKFDDASVAQSLCDIAQSVVYEFLRACQWQAVLYEEQCKGLCSRQRQMFS